jgi:hypothetical protein
MVMLVPRRDVVSGGTPWLRLALAPPFGNLELRQGNKPAPLPRAPGYVACVVSFVGS